MNKEGEKEEKNENMEEMKEGNKIENGDGLEMEKCEEN